MIRTLLVFSLFVGILACNREELTFNPGFPYVLTSEVTGIDTGGADFSATIIQAAGFEISDFGFIWTSDNISFKQSIKNTGSLEEFRTRISSDIVNGIRYSCRAYVEGESLSILGNIVEFTGKGSPSPVIISFTPAEAATFSKVSVLGNHFSHNPSFNIVSLGTRACKVLYSDPDSLVFQVPGIAPGQYSLSVTVEPHPKITSRPLFTVSGAGQAPVK